MIPLPLPPLEFRRLVGPTAPEAFDNFDRRPLVPDLPDRVHDFDFDCGCGCGCGRLARRLAQQEPRPARLRRFHSTIQLEKAATGRQSVEFLPDTAPEGVVRDYAGEPSSPAHA